MDALLQRMVRMDTVNGHVSGRTAPEAELTAYLEALAEGCFFQTRRLPVPGCGDNLLVTHQVHKDRPWILFDSHLDTVDVKAMTIDPFAAEIRDGKLFGRGACDTKGTGAAMLCALRDYADKPPQPNNIAILFSVSEEVGMDGIRRFAQHDLNELGFKPALAVVGEPTMLRAVVAHNGVMRFTVTTRGVAAHSSVPHMGKSAISAMAKVIQAIESKWVSAIDGRHDLTGKAVGSINLITGGSQINIIPERCTIEIDRRTVPGESEQAAIDALQAVLNDLQREDTSVEAELDVGTSHGALSETSNESVLPIFQDVLRAMDLPTEPLGAPFCTHAAELARAGLPSIVIGPGNPYPAHTKDEYIDLDQLRLGVEFYKTLMEASVSEQ